MTNDTNRQIDGDNSIVLHQIDTMGYLEKINKSQQVSLCFIYYKSNNTNRKENINIQYLF